MKNRWFSIIAVVLVIMLGFTIAMIGCKAETTAETTTVETIAAETTAEETTAAEIEEASSSADIDTWCANIKSKYDGLVLNVASGTHPSIEAFQKMSEEFTAKTGIKVQFDIMEGAAMKDKQLLEFTGHTGKYDVLMMDSFWVSEYNEKKVVEPLDSYVSDPSMTPEWFDYEDILPAFRNGLGTYDGVILGIPMAGETRFLAYRKDLFEKYNQKVPTTLDEMLQVAQFFNGKEEGLYGMAHRAMTGIYFASGWLSHVYSFGDGFIDQKTWKMRLNSDDVKESLDWFIKLLKTGPPDILNFTHEEATSTFVTGKSAMWFDATALVPWLEDPERSSIIGKIGYAAPPAGPLGSTGALAGWDMAISIDSKNKDAAWAFIVYMTSREMATVFYNDGGVPNRTSIFQNPEFIEGNDSIEAQFGAFDAAQKLMDRGLYWIPRNPAMDKCIERIGYYGSLPLAEGMSVDEAMAQAQEECTEILEE